MWLRLLLQFGRKVKRLPPDVGSYKDLPHERVNWDVQQAAPEFETSKELIGVMWKYDSNSSQQLEADGLNSVCRYGEVIHSSEDPTQPFTTITVDIHPVHGEECYDATPNWTKLEVEHHWREEARASRRGVCASLLIDSGLTGIQSVIWERQLCTAGESFCVDAYTSVPIHASIAHFDALPRLPPPHHLASATRDASALHRPRTTPLAQWASVITPRMAGPFELAWPPDVGHSLMMGWNESMAYLRVLVRKRIAFAVTRYTAFELQVLAEPSSSRFWPPLSGLKTRWDPRGENAEALKELLRQPFVDARSPLTRMMLALPVPGCVEGWERKDDEVGGGGDVRLLELYTQHLRLAEVPADRLLSDWQFGNLNYNATVELVEHLGQAGWNVVLVCRAGLVKDVEEAPVWADALLTVSDADEIQENLEWALATFEELAESVNGTAFVFASEDFATPMISAMHRANARNIFLDVGGALDYAISGARTRDFHPIREDASHFVRAGGALQHGQACTETRWAVSDAGFVAVHQ